VSGARIELATATRVVFGAGTSAEAPKALEELGARRIFLVTGRTSRRAQRLRELLAAKGIAVVPFAVGGEPTVEIARAGTSLARSEKCDAVLALGGGSPLDAGKAIAALATNPGDALDYLEVVGQGKAIERPPLPFVALPTTAGTGSEVTRNAVLTDTASHVKASLRSPLMLPRLAIVDPDLLEGAPPGVIASSGLDALSQNIEPFLSSRANPVTDGFAREGIRRSARSLRRAYEGQLAKDPVVREDLALASLLGGLSLANAGLGAVHGFAAPVGGMFDAPHGAVCAALLVAVMEVNLRALAARARAHPSLARFSEVASLLTGKPDPEDAIAWLAELRQALSIRGLRSYGMNDEDVPTVVERAKAASSMRGNPIVLTDEELREIAFRSL
jgi:alcohol dehydrogenase class IV